MPVSGRHLPTVASTLRCPLDFLTDDEFVLSITAFPRIGCRDGLCDIDSYVIPGPASQSVFLPDEVMNPHPRFAGGFCAFSGWLPCFYVEASHRFTPPQLETFPVWPICQGQHPSACLQNSQEVCWLAGWLASRVKPWSLPFPRETGT